MGWSEVKFDQSGTRDYAMKGRAGRFFKAWGTTVNALLNDPTSILDDVNGPLPGYNTPHPVFPNLLLDSWDARLDGVVVSATALYSNDRTFAGPRKLDILEPYFRSWSVGNYTQTIRIPYLERGLIDVKGSGDFIDPKPVWNPIYDPIEHAFGRRVYRTNAQQVSNEQIESLWKQKGNLHMLFGRWHRYDGGTATQQDKTQGWSVEHVWTFDPGTPIYARDGVGDAETFLPVPHTWLNFGPDSFVRPPYSNLAYIPNTDGYPLVGVFYAKRANPFVPDGWLTLPGVP